MTECYVPGAALVPLEVAAKELGISRSLAFTRAKTGELVPGVPVFHIAGQKVNRAQLDRFIAGEITTLAGHRQRP